MLKFFWYLLFGQPCFHEWEVLSKDTLPSAFDQLTAQNMAPTKWSGANTLFRRKIIIVTQCKHCGKMDKTIEENP